MTGLRRFIRSNIYLYIFFIAIYKKYTNLFKFLEKRNFEFLKKINSKFNNYKILNIGSNNNQIGKIIHSINKNLKIINFEPNKNLKISNTKNTKNIYVGGYSKNVKKNLFIPFFKSYPLDSLSSIYKQNIYLYLKKNKIKKNIRLVKQKFIFKKLDEYNLKTYFIKIDAEGSELEILKGLRKTIQSYYPILLIELSDLKDNSKILKRLKIEKFLKNLKYEKYVYRNRSFIKQNKNLYEDMFFLSKKSFNYLK